jgi:hypothetical protein
MSKKGSMLAPKFLRLRYLNIARVYLLIKWDVSLLFLLQHSRLDDPFFCEDFPVKLAVITMMIIP